MVGSACVFTGELKATELRFSFLSLLPFRWTSAFSILMLLQQYQEPQHGLNISVAVSLR